jgi:tetratricopeptide (TPR) repeat protein
MDHKTSDVIKADASISLLVGIWLIYESGYALLQVQGLVPSRHILFSMTGHFNNPGPFGGFIAMLMSICLGFLFFEERNGVWQRWVKRVCFVAVGIGLVVLPASLSRAGWLGLALAMTVLAFRNKKFVEWFSVNPSRSIVVMAAIVIIGVVGFLLKKDSALGRFHVWHMELRAMLKAPVIGFGSDRFAWAYGETQAAYFAAAQRAPWEVRVAGCPEYAFNEYLKAGVEWGIPGLVLAVGIALLVCIILVKNNNPLGYGAVSLAIFSFFSYPMSLWQFQICEGIFIVAAIYEVTSPKRRWAQYVILLPLLIWILVSSRTFSHKNSDYRLLYQHGYTLFKEGLYDKAIEVLREGTELSCDPMFHNIIGRCYEATGKLNEAESEYWYAHYMVPGRLYPLILLQEFYLAKGDTTQANVVMREILDIPINPKNPNMQVLRNRAEENMI